MAGKALKVSVALPPELTARLDAVALGLGCSRSALVRTAVLQWLLHEGLGCAGG